MKSFIFEDEGKMTPQEIIDNLEANCLGVESHEYIKAFNDDELQDAKDQHTDLSKQLYRLQQKLKQLSDPIKAELKEVKSILDPIIKQLDEGGIRTKEDVYLFADTKNKMMGQYNSEGLLVGTRTMNGYERNQLHINSGKREAS